MERYFYHGNPGQHPDEVWLANLTTEELAAEISRLDDWDNDLLYDLCWRADMDEDFAAADGSRAIVVAEDAAKKLGVEIS